MTGPFQVAASMLLVASTILAGCVQGRPAPPSIPPVGTTFHYVTSAGDAIAVTYEGRCKECGINWHDFGFDHDPANLLTFFHLDPENGGRAAQACYDCSEPRRWSEPLMEWNRTPGHFTEVRVNDRYEIEVSDNSGMRTVAVEQFWIGWREPQLAGVRLVKYQPGDLVPRYFESAWKGTGPSWSKQSMWRVD